MSIQSKIESKGIKARRKLFDNNIKLMGKEVLCTRFRIVKDMYEDIESIEYIKKDEITIILDFPVDGEIPLNRFRRNGAGEQTESEKSNISLFDILPIQSYFRNKDNVIRGDFFIYSLVDEYNNPIRILFQVADQLVAFGSYSIIFSKFNVAPYNGVVPIELQREIDKVEAND